MQISSNFLIFYKSDKSEFIPNIVRMMFMPEKVFINPVETALVVEDLQKDFCCADGALFVCD